MNKTTREYNENIKIMQAIEKISQEEKMIRFKYEKLMEKELAKLEPKRNKIQSKCKHSFHVYSMDGDFNFKRCVKCDYMT